MSWSGSDTSAYIDKLLSSAKTSQQSSNVAAAAMAEANARASAAAAASQGQPYVPGGKKSGGSNQSKGSGPSGPPPPSGRSDGRTVEKQGLSGSDFDKYVDTMQQKTGMGEYGRGGTKDVRAQSVARAEAQNKAMRDYYTSLPVTPLTAGQRNADGSRVTTVRGERPPPPTNQQLNQFLPDQYKLPVEPTKVINDQFGTRSYDASGNMLSNIAASQGQGGQTVIMGTTIVGGPQGKLTQNQQTYLNLLSASPGTAEAYARANNLGGFVQQMSWQNRPPPANAEQKLDYMISDFRAGTKSQYTLSYADIKELNEKGFQMTGPDGNPMSVSQFNQYAVGINTQIDRVTQKNINIENFNQQTMSIFQRLEAINNDLNSGRVPTDSLSSKDWAYIKAAGGLKDAAGKPINIGEFQNSITERTQAIMSSSAAGQYRAPSMSDADIIKDAQSRGYNLVKIGETDPAYVKSLYDKGAFGTIKFEELKPGQSFFVAEDAYKAYPKLTFKAGESDANIDAAITQQRALGYKSYTVSIDKEGNRSYIFQPLQRETQVEQAPFFKPIPKGGPLEQAGTALYGVGVDIALGTAQLANMGTRAFNESPLGQFAGDVVGQRYRAIGVSNQVATPGYVKMMAEKGFVAQVKGDRTFFTYNAKDQSRFEKAEQKLAEIEEKYAPPTLLGDTIKGGIGVAMGKISQQDLENRYREFAENPVYTYFSATGEAATFLTPAGVSKVGKAGTVIKTIDRLSTEAKLGLFALRGGVSAPTAAKITEAVPLLAQKITTVKNLAGDLKAIVDAAASKLDDSKRLLEQAKDAGISAIKRDDLLQKADAAQLTSKFLTNLAEKHQVIDARIQEISAKIKTTTGKSLVDALKAQKNQEVAKLKALYDDAAKVGAQSKVPGIIPGTTTGATVKQAEYAFQELGTGFRIANLPKSVELTPYIERVAAEQRIVEAGGNVAESTLLKDKLAKAITTQQKLRKLEDELIRAEEQAVNLEQRGFVNRTQNWQNVVNNQRQLVDDAYNRLQTARQAAARELGLERNIPVPRGFGVQTVSVFGRQLQVPRLASAFGLREAGGDTAAIVTRQGRLVRAQRTEKTAQEFGEEVSAAMRGVSKLDKQITTARQELQSIKNKIADLITRPQSVKRDELIRTLRKDEAEHARQIDELRASREVAADSVTMLVEDIRKGAPVVGYPLESTGEIALEGIVSGRGYGQLAQELGRTGEVVAEPLVGGSSRFVVSGITSRQRQLNQVRREIDDLLTQAASRERDTKIGALQRTAERLEKDITKIKSSSQPESIALSKFTGLKEGPYSAIDLGRPEVSRYAVITSRPGARPAGDILGGAGRRFNFGGGVGGPGTGEAPMSFRQALKTLNKAKKDAEKAFETAEANARKSSADYFKSAEKLNAAKNDPAASAKTVQQLESKTEKAADTAQDAESKAREAADKLVQATAAEDALKTSSKAGTIGGALGGFATLATAQRAYAEEAPAEGTTTDESGTTLSLLSTEEPLPVEEQPPVEEPVTETPIDLGEIAQPTQRPEFIPRVSPAFGRGGQGIGLSGGRPTGVGPGLIAPALGRPEGLTDAEWGRQLGAEISQYRQEFNQLKAAARNAQNPAEMEMYIRMMRDLGARVGMRESELESFMPGSGRGQGPRFAPPGLLRGSRFAGVSPDMQEDLERLDQLRQSKIDQQREAVIANRQRDAGYTQTLQSQYASLPELSGYTPAGLSGRGRDGGGPRSMLEEIAAGPEQGERRSGFTISDLLGELRGEVEPERGRYGGRIDSLITNIAMEPGPGDRSRGPIISSWLLPGVGVGQGSFPVLERVTTQGQQSIAITTGDGMPMPEPYPPDVIRPQWGPFIPRWPSGGGGGGDVGERGKWLRRGERRYKQADILSLIFGTPDTQPDRD